MALSFQFACPLPNGLHARPATHLAEQIARFVSTVTFFNERSGRNGNARSVLALVSTDTRSGDPCRLEFSGHDEVTAAAEIERYVSRQLAACDEPLAPVAVTALGTSIPRSLVAAGLDRYRAGQIACSGLGFGAAVVVRGFELPVDSGGSSSAGIAAEREAYRAAVAAVGVDLGQAIDASRGSVAEVLRAHLAVLRDPGLNEAVEKAIEAGRSAGQALASVVAEKRDVLASAQSAYIRERVLDLEDVAGRLWQKLTGAAAGVAPLLGEPSVVFAERLTPSQFLGFDRRQLRALVLGHAGQTSHAVILARSFGIPTLTGVTDAVAVGQGARRAIADVTLGIVIPDPTERVQRYYDREQRKQQRMEAARNTVIDRPAVTADGHRLEVGANIASVEEAAGAFAQGAEGIGLFRTELLFASRQTAPDEAEQVACYSAVVQAAGGRPVIIRTLDVGGDKPVPFLKFPAEANPFLGYRGVRFYAEQAALIRTQLRAILRAGAYGPVKILVPMISAVEEARQVRRLLAEAEEELKAAGVVLNAPVPLGFMLEVPSTAFLLDELCAEAEFFSLGTNDLAQYFSAADRENAAVAALNHPFQPSFLRLLRHIIDGVHARGRWIGLCGELGEKAQALPLLVGLGLDEISLAAPRIAATKQAIAGLERGRCRTLLDQVLAAPTREAVEVQLKQVPAKALPLLATELVLDQVEAESKEDVIRLIVDAVHASGRTDDPAAVEAAIWQREDAYSTGFGDGFALPHAKTDALAANTIVIARLARPVEWKALDGKPVDIVIFLGIRASEHGKAHLEILARLSRLVMRDEFRDSVRQQTDASSVVSLLSASTAPTPKK